MICHAPDCSDRYIPQAGDEIHTRVPGKFNTLQDFFVTRPGEQLTLSYHVGGIIDPITIINAHFPKVRTSSWLQYKAQLEARGGEWCAFRYSDALTVKEKAKLIPWLLDHDGSLYSVPEIFGQANDGLLSRLFRRDIRFFTKLIDIVPSWVICSGLIINGWIEIGREPESMRGVNPDQLCDHRQKQIARGQVWIPGHSPNWYRGKKPISVRSLQCSCQSG